eukprot:4564356-Amphidinium_carterae.1
MGPCARFQQHCKARHYLLTKQAVRGTPNSYVQASTERACANLGAYTNLSPLEAKLLVTLHSGAVCTNDRAHRHLQQGDGLCATCLLPAT